MTLDLEHKAPPVEADAEDDPAALPGQAVAGSPIDQLKRLHKGLAKHRTKDFDVPGYNGKLVARYKRLTHDGYTDAFGSDGTTVERNSQFLISALDGLHFRQDNDSLEAITNSAGTGTASWWDLGRLLGLEADTARSMVLRVFDGNELALNQHAFEVDQWMTSLRDADDEAFAGGS